MIQIRKAVHSDALKLKEVSDKAFYLDYIKYGECPGYGQTIEHICSVMDAWNKDMYTILYDDIVIGKITVVRESKEKNYLGCICITPEHENWGIGQAAMNYIQEQYKTVNEWYLKTPSDKLENHRFYNKCGFEITGKQLDGTVEVVIFSKVLN